jgi:C_GCAxxG_C_C family probable redox protein
VNRVETAVSCFAQGFNCSQAVFSAYAEHLGLDEKAALKIAAGFGGGMGRMAETCGAVTGALMALGLKYGATTPDRQAKEMTYERVRQFAARFKARHGSLTCRDLLGCDMGTVEGLEIARQQGLLTSSCPQFVRSAAEILEELL